MPDLKCIDTSFYCYGRHHSGGINETSIFFPTLISFKLSVMPNLEEWMEVEELIFPPLEELEIEDCPKLTTVPRCFTSIKELTVSGVNSISSLTNICRKLATLTSLSIDRVAELTYLLGGLLENNKSITNLQITASPITSLVFYNLVSLKDVCIADCEELTSLPSGLLQSCTSLHSLWIYNCSKLTSLPALGCLNRLHDIYLGLFLKELNSFPSLDPLHKLLPCLSELTLCGWPHWESIPEQLQHLTSLTFLKIEGFGIETLPDWFGNLSCLISILLDNCEKLEYLSNMESLTKLAVLYISNCPLLNQRRPGWSEISSRTGICIDGVFIRSQN